MGNLWWLWLSEIWGSSRYHGCQIDLHGRQMKVVNRRVSLKRLTLSQMLRTRDLIDMAAHDHNGTINYVRGKLVRLQHSITSYHFARGSRDESSIQIVNNEYNYGYAKNRSSRNSR